MTKFCYLGIAFGCLVMACGGSQQAPDSAATQAVEPSASSTVSSAEADATKTEEAPATKAEVEPAPSGPECKKTEDCTVFADCCTCKAVPASNPPPVPCESICGESKCEVKGMTIANVACENERCVLKKK